MRLRLAILVLACLPGVALAQPPRRQAITMRKGNGKLVRVIHSGGVLTLASQHFDPSPFSGAIHENKSLLITVHHGDGSGDALTRLARRVTARKPWRETLAQAAILERQLPRSGELADRILKTEPDDVITLPVHGRDERPVRVGWQLDGHFATVLLRESHDGTFAVGHIGMDLELGQPFAIDGFVDEAVTSWSDY